MSKSPKRARARWEKIRARLMAMCRAGEAWRGAARLAAFFHCSTGTVCAAVDQTPTLRSWQEASGLVARRQAKWPAVQAELLKIRRAGEAWPGAAVLAGRLDFTKSQVWTAVYRSPELKAWVHTTELRGGQSKWELVRDEVLQIYRSGEPYPGPVALGRRLHHNWQLVRTAIEKDRELRAWRAKKRGVTLDLVTSKGKEEPTTNGLPCPGCGSDDCIVRSSIKRPGGIRRRRLCRACSLRFTTIETFAGSPNLSRTSDSQGPKVKRPFPAGRVGRKASGRLLLEKARLSATEVAEYFGQPVNVVKKRLERWRKKRPDCFSEVEDAGSREAEFIYYLGKIREVFE